MKKTLLFSATLIVLLAFSSCEKCDVGCDHVPAKILRYDCDRVIFQILDSSTAGDAVWEDVQTGQLCNNVVSYYNTCNIASLTDGRMSTLYVHIKQAARNPEPASCYQCQAVSQSPPQTMVDFTNIATQPCDIPPIR